MLWRLGGCSSLRTTRPRFCSNFLRQFTSLHGLEGISSAGWGTQDGGIGHLQERAIRILRTGDW